MKLIITLIIFLSTMHLSAQPLVTDRPDQTESSSTVSRNALQIETGILYEFDKANGVETADLGIATTLLRYGLTGSIELRLGSAWNVRETKSFGKSNTVNGINGLYAGTKIHLIDEHGAGPETAIILSANLPVGHDSLVGDKIEPGLLVAAAHTLSDRFSIGYNFGGTIIGGDQFNFLYSAAMGIGITKKLGGFLEFYGDVPRGLETNILFDSGLTYLIIDNLQLDASAGVAINEKVPDWFVNFGLSARLPE